MTQNKKVPLRKCVGCQEMKPKKELLRVLRADTGDVLLDLTGRANGRGAYVCRDAACLTKARKNGGIARSLKAQIPEETWTALEKEMAELAKE